MKRPPRTTTKEKLVNYKIFLHTYLFIGMIETIGAFTLYFYYMCVWGDIPLSALFLTFNKWTDGFYGKTAGELTELLFRGNTVFFVALVVMQFGNLHATRTRRLSWFQHNPFSKKSRNLYLFAGQFVSLVLAVGIVYIPIFNSIFNTRPIPPQFWFIPIGMGLFVFCIDEIRKFFVRLYPNSFFSKHVAW